MGECHLDDLLDILDQDDEDFGDDIISNNDAEVQKNDKESTSPSSHASTSNKNKAEESDPDPEKEALKKKLLEMEKQMEMIKSQLGGSGEKPTNKTVTEVDMFASNSDVDNKHLRSPVKVKDNWKEIFFYRMYVFSDKSIDRS